jgi:hypothetical protein
MKIDNHLVTTNLQFCEDSGDWLVKYIRISDINEARNILVV